MRRLIAAAASVVLAASGLTGLAVVTAPTASAAPASCTGVTVLTTASGDDVGVPTIGFNTGLLDCELGPGNDSDAVAYLQIALNYCYGAGLAVDRNYGPETRAAVEYAQGLAHITVDGVYGPQTRDNIEWGDGSPQTCAGLLF